MELFNYKTYGYKFGEYGHYISRQSSGASLTVLSVTDCRVISKSYQRRYDPKTYQIKN